MNGTLRSFKKAARKLLGSTSVYQRAKTSWIYDLYWNVANRQIIDERDKEITFYRNLLAELREGDLIFDIGANLGYKADIFLRLGAKVVAIEPDEICQRILKQRFLTYRVKRKPLIIVPQAISDRSSIEKMWIDAPGSAKNTLSQKWVEALRADDKRFGHTLEFGRWKQIETTTTEQLINQYGSPFFMKIDVEGHELSVLRGMQHPVRLLSFEVNLPEFRPEGLDCIQVLSGLAPSGKFNFTPNCRNGLMLERWVSAEEFSAIMRTCTDESIEVFWKSIDERKPRESGACVREFSA